MRALAIFATLILGAVALLSGGCSLIFSLEVLGGVSDVGDFIPVWLGGFALSGLSIFLIAWMWRVLNRPAAARPEAPPPPPPAGDEPP